MSQPPFSGPGNNPWATGSTTPENRSNDSINNNINNNNNNNNDNNDNTMNNLPFNFFNGDGNGPSFMVFESRQNGEAPTLNFTMNTNITDNDNNNSNNVGRENNNGDFQDVFGGLSSMGQLLASLVLLSRNGQHKKKHASQRALESLKTVDLETLPESDRNCTICFDPFEPVQKDESQSDGDLFSGKGFSNAIPDDESIFLEEDDPGIVFPGNVTGTRTSNYSLNTDPVFIKEKEKRKTDADKNKKIQHIAVKMPCGHIFGETCIREWLKNEVTCPLCRTEVDSEESESSSENSENRNVTLYSFPLTRVYIGPDLSRAGGGHEWSDPQLAIPDPVSNSSPILGASIVPERLNNDGTTDGDQNRDQNNNNINRDSASGANGQNPNGRSNNTSNDNLSNHNATSNDTRNSANNTHNHNSNANISGVSDNNGNNISNNISNATPQNTTSRRMTLGGFPLLFMRPVVQFGRLVTNNRNTTSTDSNDADVTISNPTDSMSGDTNAFASTASNGSSSTNSTSTSTSRPGFGGPTRSSRQLNVSRNARSHPYLRSFIINASNRETS